MTAPTTFERVYAGLKTWLTEGRFHPGERLEPNHLSDELNSSVTPVRDALQRLAGERLVEAPRGEGFRVPLVSELMLRHLYAWHRDLLLLAISGRKPLDIVVDRKDEAGSIFATSREHILFIALAEATGNPEHEQAVRALIDRLEPFQRLEANFLDAIEEEAFEIARAVQQGDRRSLRSLLMRYHRRRSKIVPELVAMAAESNSVTDRGE